MDARFAAGIFLADDHIIFGFAPDDDGGSAYPIDQLSTFRLPRTSNPVKDICDVLQAIDGRIGAIVRSGNGLKSGQPQVHSLSIATPGPIVATGNVGPLGASAASAPRPKNYGLMCSKNRVVGLREINVVEKVEAFISQNYLLSITDSTIVRIFHDAAAYAFGDYALRELDFVSLQPENTDASQEYQRRTVHAHVLLDAGVGGALVRNGKLAQSSMHSELGHMMLPIHPKDIVDEFAATCDCHEANECAESFLGLGAMVARHGNDFLRDYPSWDGQDSRLNVIAYYVAMLVVNLSLIAAPSRIVFSGRLITLNPHLLSMVRGHYDECLEYQTEPKRVYPGYSAQRKDEYLDLHTSRDAGVYGCIMLSRRSDTQ